MYFHLLSLCVCVYEYDLCTGIDLAINLKTSIWNIPWDCTEEKSIKMYKLN